MPRRIDQRVVITGVGLVTPLGGDRESSWQGLVAGRSATRWLDPADLAEGSGAGPPQMFEERRCAGAPAVALGGAGDDASDSEPVTALALRAAREAVIDARLDVEREQPDRVGCVIGTSKGGLRSFARAFAANRRSPAAGPDPLDWLGFLPSTPARAVAGRFGIRGACLCPVAACATGLASLERGVALIRDHHADVVLAGSTDASLVPAVLASFARMGVAARGFDDPAAACRPFDRRRNGFVVGEGAAVVVLERLESAAARGARPYAEWLAGGSLADATGLTRLDARAEALTRLIRDLLGRAGVAADEIDYVNLHGTATVQNDLCETRAVKAALGPAARRVRCSSLKGGIGHLLGAAGSVETAAALLALRDGLVPPTVNLRDPDPQCDLDYTPGSARRQPIETALKLSLGFGGHLVAAVLRRL